MKTFVNYIYHHHHVIPLTLSLFLSLSLHSSLSSIASCKSSRLHPVSVQNCCRLVLVGRPTFARTCEEIHRRMSLMSSSLLLQQYPACLACLFWMILEMGGRWPYGCCFVGCCFQDLFYIARSILVKILA